MTKSVIANAKILTRNLDGYEVVDGDLFICDNLIEKICPLNSDKTGYDVTDAKGNLVMPGLINLHTHLYMSMMRNYADDLPFDKWLFDKITPLEDTVDKEFAFVGSQLGIMESIASGTTCVMDMHIFGGQATKACAEIGMRGYIGRGLVGQDLYSDGYSRLKESLDEIEEFGSDLIKGVLSPHAIYSCSENLFRQVNEESIKRGWLKQTHLSESENEVKNCLKERGVSPVKYLNDISFLDDRTVVAHCVKVDDEDIDVLAKSKVNVVTNPASNLKLENGICPAVKMVKNGVNLCLGTDGAASNNTQNLFREMNVFNLIHCLEQDKVKYLTATKTLDTCTINPAIAIGQSGKLGVIKQGAIADLSIVDLDALNMFPNNNIVSSLSNSSLGNEVISVMIDGKWVYKNKEFTTIDKEKVLFTVKALCKKFL